MKRYFEFIKGKSNKFWEIFHNGNEVQVIFGKIGIQNPQKKKKLFVDKHQAKKFADNKINEKLNKGYIEH